MVMPSASSRRNSGPAGQSPTRFALASRTRGAHPRARTTPHSSVAGRQAGGERVEARPTVGGAANAGSLRRGQGTVRRQHQAEGGLTGPQRGLRLRAARVGLEERAELDAVGLFQTGLAVGTLRWSSAFSDPQWLQVDLGAPPPISQAVPNWEHA